MALVIIALQDNPDGTVAVRLTTEPRVYPDQEAFTDAEKLGALALTTVQDALAKVETKRSKLLIAGADEIPH